MLVLKKIPRVFFAAILAVSVISCTIFSNTATAAEATCIDGKDGWYFYTGETTLDDYYGTNLLTEEQLQVLKQRLVYTRDALAEQGIEFVLFLAPNKERIYSEYMPDEYGPVASYTCLEQVRDYLKDDICVICPIEELLEAKEAYPDKDFYYRTDTHWNANGAYTAAKPLLALFGITTPELGDVKFQMVPREQMELAVISGRDLKDEMPYLYDYSDHYATEETDELSYYRYHTEGADSRKVMFYGDSFAIGLAEIFGVEFDDVYCIYRGYEDEDLLGREQPDIVVYEVLERFLNMLPAYPLIP